MAKLKTGITRAISATRAIPDCTERFVPALEWLGGDGAVPESTAERRAEALISNNRGILNEYEVQARVVRERKLSGLLFTTSTRIGALPLLSPMTGRVDLGLVIEPRFKWSSLGEMLAGMGFRTVPELLSLPDLPQSERHVPPWVLSSIILERMRRLIDEMQRRFVVTEEDRTAPTGAVQWDRYATTRFPLGQALRVPCKYPDLRDDEDLRSAVSWTVRHHRDALLGQMSAGSVVHHLISECDALLARLRGVLPLAPSPLVRRKIQRHSFSTRVFREGLQAIEWTAEERGLAGLSELSGIAWRLNMETFFEAWVESIAEKTARRVGAQLTTGRRNQTKIPLDWEPPSRGSQRSLIPDLVLKREDVVVVIDAKYKRHAEDIERLGWHNVDEHLREQHRNDVLQALAYSTLFDAPRVVACLAYPANLNTWEILHHRGRTFSRARVRSGARNVELALMAVPLSGRPDVPSGILETLVRTAC